MTRQVKRNAKRDFFAPGNPAIRRQVLVNAVSALSAGLAIIAIGQLLGAALMGSPLTPLGSSRAADASPSAAMPWVVVAIAGVGVSALCEFGSGLIQERAQQKEGRRIRGELLRHAFRLCPARFTGEESGRQVSMMTDSVERVTEYRQAYLGELFGAVLTPLLTLVLVALLIDPLSALVLFVCLPFVPLAIGLFQRFFRKEPAASREIRARLATKFLEAIQGLPTLVGIGAADRVAERLANLGEENRQALMRVLARNQLLLFVTEAVFSLFLVCVSVLMAWLRLEAGVITAGQAVALVLLAPQLTTPINQVGGFFYIGMGGRAGMRLMRDFLAREANGAADGDAQARPRKANGAGGQHDEGAADGHRPALPLVDVSGAEFSYEDGKQVLTGVNLSVQEGDSVSLVGASGSGKSTLISLLSGDLLPSAGKVVVAGAQLTPATQDEVRAKSAVVRQHTWLFHGTLGENLRIAAPNASDQELWSALERVALLDWARALPEGLDTHLGERGAGVSGGQAQRISIARALLSGRELILMDEPTSQVDLESEAVIERTIDEIAGQTTVLLATHRPGLVRGTCYRMAEGRAEVAQ